MHNNEFEVRIIQDNKEDVLKARKGRRLKELISRAGISFAYPCGGNGRCGKCVISFEKGAPAPGTADKNFLSEAEIGGGKRILCRCILEKECVIRMDADADEENIAAESIGIFNGEGRAESKDDDQVIKASSEYGQFGVAIDLGTTTIAAALVEISSDEPKAKVLRTASMVNHQRRYGFDVISRIEAASDLLIRKELQTIVREDLAELIKRLLDGTKISISRLCIAGNTTMLHLLRGHDVSGLGVFPYKPVTTEAEYLGAKELLGEAGESVSDRLSNVAVTLLPGISAFIGADIVAGMYELGMTSNPGQKILFLDLGTNGEMAYFDGKELTVTSTAAGPVFEGGGISCGVASVPGAISHVSITNSDDGSFSVRYETIGGKSPIGLCGTGVIEAVSELAKNGIIDKDGLFCEEFFENGFVIDNENNIRITQKDIRNVQLAKAAIRAGMERLLNGAEPDKVYIAGGFGANLDVSRLLQLNMFPEKLLDKISSVGNTSLKGCVRYIEENDPDKLRQITETAKEITLAMEDGFGEDYVASMVF